MKTLVITEVHEENILLVTEILDEATIYKLQHDDTAWGKESWSEEEVRDMMKSSTVYLINEDNKPVATFSISWEDEKMWGKRPPDAGYLHRLAVKSDHHGRGLGEEAIKAAEGIVKNKGRQYLRLDCLAANEKLCEYYEKQGFARVSQTDTDAKAALYERPVTK